jgi:5-methyltetrahydropteroyltriglutamate--homocysteine methyltransferase
MVTHVIAELAKFSRFISFGDIRQFVKPLTTVVGSFPPKKLSLERAIEWAVDVQLAHGLDVISDGEQRTDMIDYFRSLPGLGLKPNGPYVESQIKPLEKPEAFSKLQDLQHVRKYLKSKNAEDVKVKVSITGPITLGFACACNGVEHYGGMRDTRLYSDFASALKPLAKTVAETGCYVQIDEPSLSIRVMEAAQAVEIVNETLSGVPGSTFDEGKLIVHVCGPLNKPLFEELMSLDAPVLSLAFSALAVRANVETLSKLSLQGHQKKLGVGCVSVQAKTKDEVDSRDSVIQRLKAIRDKIGDEQIAFVHPDCGMRGTCEDAVEPILERVADSAEYLQKRQ